MSGAADHGKYRKLFLLSFAFTGSAATMLFLVAVPRIYIFGALLAIISNTCFGASFVLLNSFLPVLVRHHPSLRGRSVTAMDSSDEVEQDDEVCNRHESGNPTDALLRSSTSHHMPSMSSSSTPASPALQLSTRISSHG